MQLTVIEARIPQEMVSDSFLSETGYGRDDEEARANAGWPDEPADEERFREVGIQDDPPGDDAYSEKIAHQVCRFHVEEDQDTPREVVQKLKALLASRKFAAAVAFVFDTIWDRGYESE